jgi:hypothetical protein
MTMTMVNEIQIVEVKSRMKEGQKPVKRFTGYDNQYVFLVTYVLANGTELETYGQKRLLRDAKDELAKMPYKVTGHFMAKFNAEGKFWGTISSGSLY